MSAIPRAQAGPGPDETPGIGDDDDPLLGCLHIVTRLHGRPVSPAALAAGIPQPGDRFGPGEFVRAARRNGYAAQVLRRRLKGISALVLPVTLILRDGGACVLTRFVSRKTVEVVFPETGFGAREVALGDLQRDYSGYAIFAQPELSAERGEALPDDAGAKRSWFWGTLVAYWPYYLEAAIAGVLVNVLAVATALFIMNVYDRVVPNNAFETLIVLATGTAIAVGFEFLARTLRAWFLDNAGRKADLVLASEIFGQAIGLPMTARPASAGAFAAQLREFEAVRDFITSATLTVLMDIPFVAFFIFVISLVGGPLYQVPLIAVPIVLVVGVIAQIPLAIVTRANLRESALRHGLLVESLEGIEMLKAMRAEGLVRRRYEDYSALTGRSANRARTISAVVLNFTMLVQQCVTIAIVFWGVYLIAAGELTMGALVACVILTGRGLAPLHQVASLLTRYQHARNAYFTLNELMAKVPERPRGQRYTHRGEIAGGLGMQDVSFAYPGSRRESLSGLSFSLAAGEHVAVLGRVGSGKSTLLRLAMGLYPPASGTVLVDGVDLAQYDPADLRKAIGFTAQEPMLFRGTLRENITLGRPQADDEAVLEAARIAGLDGLIDGHPDGLQLPLGERGEGLSGGQRQAVANARAFLLAPAVLLLDEPTSAMDNTTEQQFIARLADFSRGRTLVLVTHKPTLLSLVGRIIVLEGGRLVMDGPRDEVLKRLTAQPAQGA